jgi:hypothetical protein
MKDRLQEPVDYFSTSNVKLFPAAETVTLSPASAVLRPSWISPARIFLGQGIFWFLLDYALQRPCAEEIRKQLS